MSPRAYAAKMAGTHTSAHQPHPISRLQATSHLCSIERIPVRGADTKTEQVGSAKSGKDGEVVDIRVGALYRTKIYTKTAVRG